MTIPSKVWEYLEEGFSDGDTFLHLVPAIMAGSIYLPPGVYKVKDVSSDKIELTKVNLKTLRLDNKRWIEKKFLDEYYPDHLFIIFESEYLIEEVQR